VINGVHAIVFSRDARAARDLFRDTLGLPNVDAGDGWLIFALPPAELAVHPTGEAPHHELYLMCDDIHATVEELKRKGVEFSQEITEQRWGLTTSLRFPGGGELGLYEPRHPRPPIKPHGLV
jgi:catechol 2,3-dioxygenase-like lactoylglutathione lyase family enzyme